MIHHLMLQTIKASAFVCDIIYNPLEDKDFYRSRAKGSNKYKMDVGMFDIRGQLLFKYGQELCLIHQE